MSALWTAEAVAEATGGTVIAPFEATGVSIDSRSIEPGDLFVPIVDARDGHDFITAALDAGAAGILTAKDHAGPGVRVADTMKALVALGQAGRDRSPARRVAVTGSVGKTSVKDALGVMLGAFGPTHVSQRSFNNHLGVPITLATLPRDARFAVFETGMNHAGELTELSRQVAPEVALITTVAGAHTAHFDSIEAIADAKAEIRHGLTPEGILILNGDNAYTPRIAGMTSKEVRTFGRSGEVTVVGSEHTAQGGTVRLRVRSSVIEVTHALPGAHWDHNIAACIAVADALQLDLDTAAAALGRIQPSEGRGDTASVEFAGKSVTLVDQSYNANPASMRAAIAAAALLPGRKVALLGEMRELGADELALHAALTEPLEQAGYSRVLTVGECMRALRGALPRAMRGEHADTAELIRDALAIELRDGDVLLIKGSNATGLGKLAAALKAGDG